MRRSIGALGLGAVALLGAWLFGSIALAPVGWGFIAAGTAALAWRQLAVRSLELHRRVSSARLVEGDDLLTELRVTGRASRWGRVTAHESIAGVGECDVPLVRGRGVLQVHGVPRGRHVPGPARVVLEDPLGLERAEVVAAPSGSVLVTPRFVTLERLFTDRGHRGLDGGRDGSRRAAGSDPHSVRDHRDGEPLRLVHWPTTARRGALTVLEMQDAPPERTVVVLDGDPRGVAGRPGRTSYDEAVRVAATLVHAYATRGHRVGLAGAGTELLLVAALDRSWDAALEALAVARPGADRALSSLLADARLGVGRQAELLVVTCRPEAVDLVTGDGRRVLGIVLVDAPTYAGAAASPASTALLRAAADGSAVAVVRSGGDLAAALGGTSREARSA